MGYLRKRSFIIFHDPDAPTEERTLDPEKVAEIEAAHEAGKKGRINDLIKARLRAQARVAEMALSADRMFAPDLSPPPGTRGVEKDAATLEKEKGAEARIAQEAETGASGEPWRNIVRMVQDVVGAEEEALKEYIRKSFGSTNEQRKREFAWDVYKVVTSKAELPDTRYRPWRTPESTVRFKDGHGRFGVNEVARSQEWDENAGEYVKLSESQALQNLKPTLWVKVTDGRWEKDGNWGGHLQITCATDKGKWIDSSDGWLWPQSSKGDKITFYDMGAYYEIWQKDRETGRPLVVEGERLRFSDDKSKPGRFNLHDATWD
ncbi:hypothetical protein ACFV0Y_19490 [Streptomyces sp. NPDC059569]|uniref:hypothetical protein n=1 Tax=Streptomyces sp. NPDC059569 TaxID=3346869 RepID=UPI003673FC37